jgi:outer membrane protein OmpA-like peptidoglycan-associated protein
LLSRLLRGVLVCAAFGTIGCGASLSSRPVKTDAELGRVVIYRSGVAYFERTASVKDGKLRITVPAERVDDFLKSLTIEDAASGKTLPVAFPTSVERGDQLELEISVPRGARRVKMSYVTESPAWKPSYRLVLDDQGRGKLEAWAIVDNVSGEDWKSVLIGVGSTSALSFRYDLHSVRHIARETLSDGAAVAHAPPTGGSPYQVAGQEMQVIGNVAHDELERFEKLDKHRVLAGDDHRTSGARKPPARAASTKAQAQLGNTLDGLAEQLKKSKQRFRVEGYARAGDKDQRAASIERANQLRNALIENGVRPDQVEAVGTGELSSQAARVLALQEPAKPTGASAPGSDAHSNEPIGTAYFVAPGRMTIEKDRSAMVNVLATQVAAKRVYFYDPISARGSKKLAFRAVRLENPSEHTLEPGPFTVYASGQFLGEGMSDPIPPKSSAFVPYALDRELLVDPTSDTREELERLVTIERGIVTAEARRIRSTRLSLVNRGRSAALVYVRHQVPNGWKLRPGKIKPEKLRGAHLFPIQVAARTSVDLLIEETQPMTKTVDIHTDPGVKEIGLFLETTRDLDPELRSRLDEVVKLHRAMHDVQDRIDTLRAQMATLRERIDEIHVQLVTLRRVGTAQKLSRQLAKKMEEISDRLQKSTIQVTDLEASLMTSRISIQDHLAELSLEPAKSGERAAVVAGPR